MAIKKTNKKRKKIGAGKFVKKATLQKTQEPPVPPQKIKQPVKNNNKKKSKILSSFLASKELLCYC